MFEPIRFFNQHKDKQDLGHVEEWLSYFNLYEWNEQRYIRRINTDPLTSFPTQRIVCWFVMTNNEGASAAFECEMSSRESRSYNKWADYIAADMPLIVEDATLVLLKELRPYLTWRLHGFIGWSADSRVSNPASAAEAFCLKGYSRKAMGFKGDQKVASHLS